jgi:hypothetical protein
MGVEQQYINVILIDLRERVFKSVNQYRVSRRGASLDTGKDISLFKVHS